ncbi:MAG: GNAT family N-acetyltransferase [Flavobacteriaceae bacterium]|nr:GNAT family N-acetyltransferase [Flavobacteriaceae bacterium]
MEKNIAPIVRDQLFSLDLFFKNQFKGKSRYGTMGSFFWKMFTNPFGKGFVNAIHHEGNIVATTSITPKSLFIKQVEYTAAEIGDTYTDRKFQGRGLFSLLVNESRKVANDAEIKFIYGTPNNQSLPGYIKNTGFNIVNEFKISTYRFELRVDHILRSKIGGFLASVINLIFVILIRLFNFSKDLFYPSFGDYKIEVIDSLDKNWDEFWREASSQWDVIFKRDSKSLYWRFFLNPDIYYFLVVKESDRIVGYTVYRIMPDVSGNRIVIADFLFLKEHSKAFNNCLKTIKKSAFDLDINTITLWCDSSSLYHRTLVKNGFFPHKKVPLICYMDAFYSNFKGSNTIHFTMSDSDNV